MNDSRNFKIVLENSLMTKEVEEAMRHSKDNLIDLESNSSDENSSDSNQNNDPDKVGTQNINQSMNFTDDKSKIES